MILTRKPTAAGVFYPASREELARRLGALLDAPHLASVRALRSGRVKAIVAPHAHYDACGPIAAAAWAQIGPFAPQIRRLIVLGPTHHLPFWGVAAPLTEAFETPLGVMEIDRVAIETARRWPQLSLTDMPHDQDHSIEVQLPFAQTLLETPAVVPLLVGDTSDEEVAAVLETVWSDAALIVVSTDLSRYHDAATAERLDEATARAIEQSLPDAIDEDRACGDVALRALLRFAKRHALRATRVALGRAPSLGAGAGCDDMNAEVFGFGAFTFA
ncbi:MAG TPA: AmmeMemoRadiSam system protein B [Polyangiaceae bacterium]|nr:AmmeMemoRadiSam system protein B [Polyangiaceae bacterium]